jgi:hypothetical protein
VGARQELSGGRRIRRARSPTCARSSAARRRRTATGTPRSGARRSAPPTSRRVRI